MTVRIPVVREQQVQQRGIGNITQQVNAPAAAFGSQQAQAIQQGARALDNTSDQLNRSVIREADETNALKVMEFDNAAQREAMDFIYNPEGGLLTNKGGFALDAPEKAKVKMQEIKDRYTELAKDNPTVAAMMKEKLDGLTNSTLDLADRHRLQEMTTYKSETLTSRQQLNTEAAALNWNDDNQFKGRLEANERLLIDQGKTNGWGVETLTQKRQELRSSMYSSRIQAMANTDTPGNIVKAKQLYDQSLAAGDIDLATATRLDNFFDAAVPKAAAQVGYTELKSTGSLDNLPPEKVFNGMIARESNGKQFDANGQPLKSSAGALGIAQVMPATGPEAAAAAGLAWDEEKFKNDAGYNKALGQAYFNKQVQAYGNTTLAVMAYNAGGGAVNDFMNGTNLTGKNPDGKKLGDPRKGETTIDKFVTQFPYAETRKYVAAVAQNAGAGADPTLAQVQAKAAELEILNPGAGTAMLSLYERDIKLKTAAKKASETDFLDSVMPKIQSANGDFTVLSPDELATAKQLGVYDQITSWKGASDPDLKLRMLTMSADELATVDLSAPEYRLKLSMADTELFAKQQKKAAEAGGSSTHDRILKSGSLMLKASGLNPNPKADDPAGAEKLVKFLDVARQDVDAFVAEKKRQPSEVELKKILDPLLLEGTLASTSPTSWINWDGKKERKAKAYDALPNEVFYVEPPDDDTVEATRKAAEGKLEIIRQSNPDWLEEVDGKVALSQNGVIRYYTKLRQRGMTDDQITAMYGQ